MIKKLRNYSILFFNNVIKTQNIEKYKGIAFNTGNEKDVILQAIKKQSISKYCKNQKFRQKPRMFFGKYRERIYRESNKTYI